MSRTTRIRRSRTAIGRGGLSRPIRLALESNIIGPDRSLFDYGCGRGDDLRLLGSLGIRCDGWDPAHRPATPKQRSDIVSLGYVVNVIENPVERVRVLEDAWRLTEQALIVAARLKMDASGRIDPYGDGYVTVRNTFQKYYTQVELREWIEQTLGVAPVAVGPGVFLVFRDSELQQIFLDTRYRRHRAAPTVRKSDVLFEQHRDLLEPLISFVTNAGRIPTARELPEAQRIVEVFGSIRRAFSVVRRVTGTEQWDRIRVERHHELLCHLALEKFRGRPRFSALPPNLQLDVREFFSSYKGACEQADRLLFSAGNQKLVDRATRQSEVGKLTPTALYVHADALYRLPQLLRVYEGCARAFIGLVEDANIIKLYRDRPAVSYLVYPDFDKDPHPMLSGSTHIDLSTPRSHYRGYESADNPPILHRKEAFVSEDHPHCAKFARLTRQEERWGLFEDVNRIGTRAAWNELLARKGVALRGHRLVRTNRRGEPCAS